ncbi:hypothetical protein Bbelb_293320 [Branchiostoma belcheri]|nr:hypothetical protein Bbelb_293320 [Branchiostoma belcheri]
MEDTPEKSNVIPVIVRVMGNAGPNLAPTALVGPPPLQNPGYGHVIHSRIALRSSGDRLAVKLVPAAGTISTMINKGKDGKRPVGTSHAIDLPASFSLFTSLSWMGAKLPNFTITIQLCSRLYPILTTLTNRVKLKAQGKASERHKEVTYKPRPNNMLTLGQTDIHSAALCRYFYPDQQSQGPLDKDSSHKHWINHPYIHTIQVLTQVTLYGRKLHPSVNLE